MRFRRIQATLIAAVMMANGLAPAITISAAEQTAQSETTSTAESGPFYTYTNEVKNGTSSEVTKNVTGYYSINNNNQGVDYKISQERFEAILSAVLDANTAMDKECKESPLQSLSGLGTAKSYLIEHGFISRDPVIQYSSNSGINVTIPSSNDSLERMNKTELITALYKICYGVLESRPIIWNVKPFRQVNGVITPVSVIDNYLTTGGLEIKAVFENDKYFYVSPNVYELYLSGALDKGLIQSSDLNGAKTLFPSEYSKLQSSGIVPAWHQSLGNVEVEKGDSARYLGSTATISNTDKGIILSTKRPDYFIQEDISTIDALKIIEKFLRSSEKEMTNTEATTISYKYGAKYLDTLNESDRQTVTFLIAKGILNFEDPAEYVDLYSPFSFDVAYTLLYRVANKDARFNFSEIQLTDSEIFWQSKGYDENTIHIYSDEVPEIRVLDSDVSFEDISDAYDRTSDFTTGSNDGVTVIEPETEPETQTEHTTESEQKTSGLAKVRCLDKDTKQPVSGIQLQVKNSSSVVVGEAITDQDGYAYFDLPYGDYLLQQASTPDTYAIDNSTMSFRLADGNDSVEFEFQNVKSQSGIVSIEAIESVTENVIKNVSFVIYDSDGNKYKTIVTEDDGKCKATLPYGVYTIQITGVPEGYNDEKAIQTIKLSELNLEQSIRFTIDLKPTIIEAVSEAFTEKSADAAQIYYTIKMLLEKKDNCKYTYDGTELTESVTAAEIPDLADSITTKDYDGTTMYLVSFKVQADSKDTALSIINKKLKIDLPAGEVTAPGVTQIDSDDGKDKITLISSKAFKESLTDIKVVNANTLINTKTQTTALLLNEQGYALVGNKVIVADDLLIEDKNGDVYYNLEVICSLLSNAELKSINGATSLVSKSIQREDLYTVNSEYGTSLEHNYVAQFDGVTKIDVSETGQTVTKPMMYNLDAMTRGESCLTREFTLDVTDKNGKTVTTKVNVIVEWDFIVPAIDSAVARTIQNYTNTADRKISYNTVTEVINTAPEGGELLEWWNYNLAMSNALANWMYGTSGTQYVTCGYMVPSVTILSNAGGSRKDSSLGASITMDAGSLSDAELNKLFSKFQVNSSYVSSYLGGAVENWWDTYYNAKNTTSETIKTLIAKAKFRSYSGSQISFKDSGTVVKDGYAFHNADYLVLKNGTVYANAENSSAIKINKSKKTLTVKTSTNTKVVIPAVNTTKVTKGQRQYLYTGTLEIGNNTYYKMMPLDGTGAPLMYSGYNTQSTSGQTGLDNSAFADPSNYKNDQQQTLLDFEKMLYQDWGNTGVPFTNESLSRFSLYKKSLANGKLYLSFMESSGSPKVKFYQGNSNGGVDSVSLGTFVTRTKSQQVNISAYVYLPTNEYYFAYGNNNTVELKEGSKIGILNSRIYYTSLNNVVRDSIIAEMTNTISVNKLATGKQVYVGSLLFTRQSDGTFLSGPITPTDSSMASILTAIEQNNSKTLKSNLIKVFSGQVIMCGGRSISLQSFIKDATIGPLVETDKTKVLYKTGNKYYYKKNSEKKKVAYKDGENGRVDSYMLSLKLDDALLCRPLDASSNTYQMLYVTDVYASSGLGDLAFYPEYYSEDRQSSLVANWQQTVYAVNQFTEELKTEFMDDYTAAFHGDLIRLAKLLIILVLSYLMVILPMAYIVLRYQLGINFLKAIAMPSRTGKSFGIDLVRLMTLGIYSVTDTPKLGRLIALYLFGTMYLVALLKFM